MAAGLAGSREPAAPTSCWLYSGCSVSTCGMVPSVCCEAQEMPALGEALGDCLAWGKQLNSQLLPWFCRDMCFAQDCVPATKEESFLTSAEVNIMCWAERGTSNPTVSETFPLLNVLLTLLPSGVTCTLDGREGHKNLSANMEQKDLWTFRARRSLLRHPDLHQTTLVAKSSHRRLCKRGQCVSGDTGPGREAAE